jgi:hypothetical protein
MSESKLVKIDDNILKNLHDKYPEYSQFKELEMFKAENNANLYYRKTAVSKLLRLKKSEMNEFLTDENIIIYDSHAYINIEGLLTCIYNSDTDVAKLFKTFNAILIETILQDGVAILDDILRKTRDKVPELIRKIRHSSALLKLQAEEFRAAETTIIRLRRMNEELKKNNENIVSKIKKAEDVTIREIKEISPAEYIMILHQCFMKSVYIYINIVPSERLNIISMDNIQIADKQVDKQIDKQIDKPIEKRIKQMSRPKGRSKINGNGDNNDDNSDNNSDNNDNNKEEKNYFVESDNLDYLDPDYEQFSIESPPLNDVPFIYSISDKHIAEPARKKLVAIEYICNSSDYKELKTMLVNGIGDKIIPEKVKAFRCTLKDLQEIIRNFRYQGVKKLAKAKNINFVGKFHDMENIIDANDNIGSYLDECGLDYQV